MKTLEKVLEENSLDLETLDVEFDLAMAEAAVTGESTFMFEGVEYEVTMPLSEAQEIWGPVEEAKIIVMGVMGANDRKFKKTFKTQSAADKWIEKNDDNITNVEILSEDIDKEVVSEALTNAQRRKKSIQMKKGKAARLRKRKIAEKKLSSPDKIDAKARKKARGVIEKKLSKGKDKSEMSFSQRQALEKKVEKKSGAIARIAKRMKKDVKKDDRERVKARRSAKND